MTIKDIRDLDLTPPTGERVDTSPGSLAHILRVTRLLYDVLKGIEWIRDDGGNGPFVCPSCGALERQGHTPDDCDLAAALALAEGRQRKGSGL